MTPFALISSAPKRAVIRGPLIPVKGTGVLYLEDDSEKCRAYVVTRPALELQSLQRFYAERGKQITRACFGEYFTTHVAEQVCTMFHRLSEHERREAMLVLCIAQGGT